MGLNTALQVDVRPIHGNETGQPLQPLLCTLHAICMVRMGRMKH